MNASKQKQRNIICVNHDSGPDYELCRSDQSPIDLENQPELPVSLLSVKWSIVYTAFRISKRLVVIKIDDSTDTFVKIEYPWRSEPLHVHIIEELCSVGNLDGDKFDEVCAIIAFVIFDNHILKIRLTNTYDGYSVEEYKTDFSFHISDTESSSFTIIEDERNELLRVCLILNEHCWKKVELFEICLLNNDGERLFTKTREKCFRLPPNFMVIEIDCDSNSVTLCLEGESIKFPIYIYDEKNDEAPDDPIFLLNEDKRCILSTSEQLYRFQGIRFEIVATMYVCPFEDHADLPEIQAFIKALLELNKYHRCQLDSDYGSDSDSGSDSDYGSD